MLKKKKAQSVLEYVIVFSVIIAAVIGFTVWLSSPEGSGLGKLTQKAGSTINSSSDKIVDMTK